MSMEWGGRAKGRLTCLAGMARQWPVVRRGGAIERSGGQLYGAGGAKAMANRVYIMHVIVIMIGARVRGENTLTIIIHHHDDTGSPPPF